MHLDPLCTGLSPAAINGIKDLGMNVMLLCNTCVENNERDNFIKGRAQAVMTEKIEGLKLADRLEEMEKRKTELVDEKIDQALKTTCEKVEKTYCQVATEDSKKEGPQNQPSRISKAAKNTNDLNIQQSFRIQGIPEDPKKSKGENLVPTNEAVQSILTTLGVKPQVTELKRLGKFDNPNRSKPRTLMVTLANEHEVRLVLAKSREKREELSEKNSFILPALSKEDSIKENLLLRKRKELIEANVPREKLKSRNLELWNDGVKVVVSQEGVVPGY